MTISDSKEKITIRMQFDYLSIILTLHFELETKN